MASGWKVGFVLGTFVLAAALFFPILIEAGDTTKSNHQIVTESEYGNVTETLSVKAVYVNESNNTAKFRYRNNRDFNRSVVQLNLTTPAENKTISLSNENITSELRTIEDNTSALLNTTYPSTFGWNGPSKTLWSNMGLFIALLALAMVGGVLVVVLTKL